MPPEIIVFDFNAVISTETADFSNILKQPMNPVCN